MHYPSLLQFFLERVVEDGGIEVDRAIFEEMIHGAGLDEVGGGAGEDLAVGGDEPKFVGEHKGLGNVVAREQDSLAAVVGKGLQQTHRLDAAGDVEKSVTFNFDYEKDSLKTSADFDKSIEQTLYIAYSPVAQRGHPKVSLLLIAV